MVQFNPTTTPRIENSEGPARPKWEEVDMPLDAETVNNPPIAVSHEAIQDIAGGIVSGHPYPRRIMMIWRFVENALLNGKKMSHNAECQDSPNVAPVSPSTPQLTPESWTHND